MSQIEDLQQRINEGIEKLHDKKGEIDQLRIEAKLLQVSPEEKTNPAEVESFITKLQTYFHETLVDKGAELPGDLLDKKQKCEDEL